eukprot:1158001-Pelagomonas_calceolata.AAC.4
MNQAAKRLVHIADHILAPMSAPSSSRGVSVCCCCTGPCTPVAVCLQAFVCVCPCSSGWGYGCSLLVHEKKLLFSSSVHITAPLLSLQAKVAVLGASGGIGQPLSMLLKTSPRVSELSLYDVANTPGVAADLGHINTGSTVKGYVGPDQLPEALQGCDLVVIPAGVSMRTCMLG